MFSISTETNVLLASSTGLTGYCPKWILLLCGSLKTYADDHLQLWLTDFGACKISQFGDKGNELWHQREMSGFTSSVRIRQKVYSTDKQRGSNWKNQQIESEARAFDECLSDKWLSLSESEQSEANGAAIKTPIPSFNRFDHRLHHHQRIIYSEKWKKFSLPVSVYPEIPISQPNEKKQLSVRQSLLTQRFNPFPI